MNSTTSSDALALIPCVLMLFLVLVGLALSVLWLIALVHAAIHRMENQAVWLLVIILGGPIGAVAYFIARPYKSRD